MNYTYLDYALKGSAAMHCNVVQCSITVGICGGQGGPTNLTRAVLSSRNERQHMKYTPIIIKLRPREPTNEVDSALIANQEAATLPRYF